MKKRRKKWEYRQNPSSEAATTTLFTESATLGLLVGSWKRRKMKGKKDDKGLNEGVMATATAPSISSDWRRNGNAFTTGARPIRTGPSFLQGEKEKQIASTVLFVKPHFSPSHPLHYFQDPLFMVWSPSSTASNLTIYPLIQETHCLISTSWPTSLSPYIHSKIHQKATTQPATPSTPPWL